MKKWQRGMMLLLLIISGIFLSSGCASSPTFDDITIKAHWMRAGEIAPFDGVLLNDYTYYEIRKKLIQTETN
jgi:hypothetical protein